MDYNGGVYCSGRWFGSLGLIYGSCNPEDRRIMYDEITEDVRSLSYPLMLLGDYNEILSLEERQEQSRVTNFMHETVEGVCGI